MANMRLPASKNMTPVETPSESIMPNNNITSSNDSKEQQFKLGTRERIVFAVLMIISFYSALESTSIGVALPSIAQDIHATSTQAFWIGISYILVSSVSQPVFASFSHIFGRRPVVIVSLVFFIAGTIICSVAANVPVILVGRTIQGLGTGGGLALIEILITDIVPLKQRGPFIGLISLAWAFGCAVAPVMGGAFAQKVTWRWIFWIILPFSTAALVLLPISLRLQPINKSIREKITEVDWLGGFLLVASAVSFLIAISWGGVMFAWSSASTLAPLIFGIVGLGVYVAWEIYGAKKPLIPMRIFSNRTSATIYWQSMVSGLNLWTAVYYLPLYYQAVKELSPILSGVAIFPELLTVPPAAVITGFAISRIGSYRKVLWAGWLLATLGVGIMILLDVQTTTVQWIFLNLITGIGIGMLLPVMRIAVQASTADEDMAFAAAMTITMRYLGLSLSIAIFGIITQNIFQQKLQSSALSILGDTRTQDLLSAVELIGQLPSDSPDKLILQKALVEALRVVWETLLAFNVVALISSLFTKELSLERVLQTEQGVEKSG